MAPPTRTAIVPPRLASLPREWEQLEYSSRSLVVVGDGRRLLRAWGAPEAPWVLAVEPVGHRWQVEAPGGRVEARAVRAAARALFSFAHPIEEFYRQVRSEPVLRGTERRFRGLRLPRDANLYEALFHSIVGQQLSVAAANAVKRRLIERTRSVLVHGRVEVPHVPRPSALRALGPEGLRAVGVSGAKARALGALAATADFPPERVAEWRRGELAAAIEALTALPGVGRWTAENALLRGVGRPDVFVGGDLGIRVALDAYGVVPRGAPEATVRAWADRHYTGWGSYATLYLWRKWVEDRPGKTG